MCRQYVLSITHLFVSNYYKCWKRSRSPFVCLCVVYDDTSRQLLIDIFASFGILVTDESPNLAA